MNRIYIPQMKLPVFFLLEGMDVPHFLHLWISPNNNRTDSSTVQS